MIWRVAVRSAQMHPARALFTICSITLAVCSVTAVGKSIAGARLAYAQLTSALSNNTSLIISSRSGNGIDDEVVRLAGLQKQVLAATGVSRNSTIMYAHGKRMQVVAIGTEQSTPEISGRFELVSGHRLSKSTEVLIDQQLANQLNLSAGDTVKLLTRAGLIEMPVAGLVRINGITAIGGTSMIFLPLEDMRWLFRRRKTIDSVELQLKDTDSAPEVKQELESTFKALYPDLDIRATESDELLGTATLRSIEIGLKLASSVAFVLAAIMVLNAFFISLGERRRILALLRAVGASRPQVLGLVLAEALLLGVIATLIGIPVGLGLCWLLDRAMAIALTIPIPAASLDAGTLLKAVAVGTVGTLVAALLPALRATYVHPLEAIKPMVARHLASPPLWCAATSTVLLLATIGLWWLANLERGIPQLVYVGAASLLVGTVFAVPGIMGPFTMVVAVLLNRLVGLPSTLARRQLTCSPLRSTMTVGIIFIGLASGIAIGNTVSIHVANVTHWWKQSFVSSYYMRAMLPDLSLATHVVVPPDITSDLEKVEGVASVETLRLLSVNANGQRAIMFIRDYYDRKQLNLDIVKGQPAAVLADLIHGDVVVGSVFAERHNIAPGSMINLQTEQGLLAVRVAGVSSEYIAGGNVIHCDRRAALQLFEFEGADVYAINVHREHQPTVGPALRQIAEEKGLLLMSLGEMTEKVDRMTLMVSASLWCVLAVALVIMGFGVSTTIAINVTEQVRDLELLRIVGASRAQVICIVMSEATMLFLLGVAPAVPAGLLICYVANRVSLAISGYAPQFEINAVMSGCLVAVTAGLVMAAAAGPARRAACGDGPPEA